MKGIENLYKYCKILQNECIKKEVEDFLKGFTEEENRKLFEYNLKNESGDKISISFKPDYLHIDKSSKNSAEIITVFQNLIMIYRKVEKRENGIVITEIHKSYEPSHRFNNQVVLTDLKETRYTLTKETIEKSFRNVTFETARPIILLYKSRLFELKNNLKEIADFTSEFSTHMNYYIDTGNRKIKDNIYPSHTYLFDKDISRIYDLVDGPDKIYRIYDLYRGIINKRNETDINSIHLGLLSEDAFDLISKEEITRKENNLVGDPSSNNEEYINYLKQLFDTKYGYQHPFTLDRESILKAINYQMTPKEIAKRYVESKLGIPYSEYEELSIEEQHKLIEEKTGKKVKPNYLLHIDGIPMDENHMYTSEKANKAIDKITESTPKRVIKKVLNKLKPKQN